MTPRRVTFDTVRDLALALPDTEEGLYYGTTAFFVRGRMFACQPSHPSAEPASLVVRVSFEQRDDLLEAEPETYYLKDHYVGYACVLVRLARVHPDALRGLLRTAHTFMGAAKTRPARTRRRQAKRP